MQTRYTTTERELLSIVETLKEFRNILLGQEIMVYTDHQNLTYKNFNTKRVMRWRLILEEFNPTLTYIKGENNIVADALSRLDIAPKPLSHLQTAEAFGLEEDDFPSDAFLLSYKTIMIHQQADDKLKQLALTSDNYSLTQFHGGGKTRTIIIKKQ